MLRIHERAGALVVALALFGGGCASARHEAMTPRADPAWLRSLDRWKAERNEEIGGQDGWLTLVTRAWLAEGPSRIGSDRSNEIVLPADRAPSLAGTLVRKGAQLHFVAADGIDVRVNGEPKRELDVIDDHDGRPTVWTLGTLSFRVIRRQDRFALRVKDSAHPARAAFGGLSFYPPDPAWRLSAKLAPAPAGKTIRITNVLGQVEDMPSPGTLKFQVGGREYGLDAVLDRGHDGLFVLFKDASAGHGTYPSGRFLYTGRPAADGSVELDFNRAFTPPCAFTTFATCPLAPSQNQLALTIEAGERFQGGHGDGPPAARAASIVQSGHPVLRGRAAEVPVERIVTSEMQDLAKRMVDTMRAAPGVGLAAPQIGVPLRVIVLEDRSDFLTKLTPDEVRERERVAFPPRIIFNPVLGAAGGGRAMFFEGCLSVQGYVGLVERDLEVEVTGLDENAQPVRWKVRGWPARILQHEVDHLDGMLYVDRMLTRSFSTADQAKALYGGKPIAEIRSAFGL